MKEILAELANEYNFFPKFFIPRPNSNFDVLTSTLVKKFQEYVGLTPDGIFGKATYDAMEKTYSNYIIGAGLQVYGIKTRRY
jgi:murein L,D-transpeptidase YcbB/YkuD